MEQDRFRKNEVHLGRMPGNGLLPEMGEEEPLKIRNRILKKIAEGLGEIEDEGTEPVPAFYSERRPDVIVIPDDQSLLFEAQNAHALEVLSRICGMAPETVTLFEPIRVHPCRSSDIIEKLKGAGASVI